MPRNLSEVVSKALKLTDRFLKPKIILSKFRGAVDPKTDITGRDPKVRVSSGIYTAIAPVGFLCLNCGRNYGPGETVFRWASRYHCPTCGSQLEKSR
jgi:predicted RNA-binding Zn-ribbon protein involved in translation (DUF1610 family)